jgi:hypothetical protein
MDDIKAFEIILKKIEMRDQLLAEIVTRLSTLENVLIDKKIITKEELIEGLKKSLQKLVKTLSDNGVIEDNKSIIDSLNKKITN